MDIDPVQPRQDEATLRPVLSGRETARAWRLGWLAAALLAGGAVAFVPASTGWPVWIALLAGALPAIAALLLGDSEDERVQSLLLVGWAAG
ncbi:two-component sensor histidine kinase, partial [Caulobacter sp. D4A]